MRIRTYTNPLKRAALWLWDACERHFWLPLLIAFIGLVIVNSVEASF